MKCLLLFLISFSAFSMTSERLEIQIKERTKRYKEKQVTALGLCDTELSDAAKVTNCKTKVNDSFATYITNEIIKMSDSARMLGDVEEVKIYDENQCVKRMRIYFTEKEYPFIQADDCNAFNVALLVHEPPE